ncbi:hypothetical protein DES53_101138 [Roseimicrobium gellanilyticum]|uniref:Carbohydrate binding protein n=1 Tax=Roseimicrobium gellanilyticum TaxID=748857 RepID=A0A366HST8_9BACT|nr:hypothetical protein [Roseimicrobium gellanilyticum]RBP47341.1 hypothetical protein DES53_101138 [Roseimicrobium gellanilyticum]
MKPLNFSSTLCRCILVSAMAVAPLHAGDILGRFSCHDIAQVKTSISIDKETTADGNGSIKVEAAHNAVVTVADQKNLSVSKDNTLWCTVKVKCSGVKQRAYLEMWCEVADGKRAFSKGLEQLLLGDSDWKEIRLPMMINGDFTVNRALVNVVIEGPGTVWVDQISFAKAKGLSAVYVPES